MTAAPAGHFCWPERLTLDPAPARAFLETLLGWTFEPVPSSGGAYLLAQREGEAVGALLQAPPQAGPPRWNSYVQVVDAEASAREATALGGTLTAGPFEVPGVGRMAFLQDPCGAALALWQAGGHPGATRFGRPGGLAWTELVTPEPGRAATFYGGLFGWEARPRRDLPRPYVEFLSAGTGVGGMLPASGKAAAWMPYFGCEDPERDAERARKAGGRIVVPPTVLPDIGTFAILADPEGVKLGLIRLGGA